MNVPLVGPGADPDVTHSEKNTHMKGFYSNQAGHGHGMASKTQSKLNKNKKNIEHSQSLTRPTMLSMTVGSGNSTTPPITTEYQQQSGSAFQQSKTERKHDNQNHKESNIKRSNAKHG